MLTVNSEEERRARAAEDAAAWLLRLESDSLSAAERAKFVEWLRASPLHVAEMRSVARLRNSLANFSQWSSIAPLDPEAENSNAASPTVRNDFESLRGAWGWRAAPPLWLAGAAAVVVSLTIFLSIHLSQTVIQTELGERREMALADGSEVIVAPNSRIRINLGSTQRLVALD